MASSCTFAGAPFLLPTPEVEEWFRLRMPLDGFRVTNAERTWPGANQLGLAYPQRWPDRPQLKLNQFYYPSNLSRWGEFNGVVDRAGYDAISRACFTPTGPASQTFKLSQDGFGEISTPMFALPPKPLSVAGGGSGLYLVTLVDQRYFLQFTTPGDLTVPATWDSLLGTVAATIGITLGFDACDSAYATPHPQTDLAAKYASAPALLDAVAANTGRVIVRNWDGTYYAQNHDTAATTEGENRAATIQTGAGGALGYLAGGDFTADGANATLYSTNAILPYKVTVAFPYYLIPSSSYVNAGSGHIPFPLTQGDMYKVEVPIATALPGTKYVGFAGTLTVRTTAEAYVCTVGGTPQNLTSMQSLAQKIAADWYSWQVEGLEVTIPGVAAWAPEGVNDLLVVWTREQTFTRVQRKPLNYLVEEYQHHFAKPTCPSSSSSSSKSSSSSSSSSTGCNPTCQRVVTDVQCVGGRIVATYETLLVCGTCPDSSSSSPTSSSSSVTSSDTSSSSPTSSASSDTSSDTSSSSAPATYGCNPGYGTCEEYNEANAGYLVGVYDEPTCGGNCGSSSSDSGTSSDSSSSDSGPSDTSSSSSSDSLAGNYFCDPVDSTCKAVTDPSNPTPWYTDSGCGGACGGSSASDSSAGSGGSDTSGSSSGGCNPDSVAGTLYLSFTSGGCSCSPTVTLTASGSGSGRTWTGTDSSCGTSHTFTLSCPGGGYALTISNDQCAGTGYSCDTSGSATSESPFSMSGTFTECCLCPGGAGADVSYSISE